MHSGFARNGGTRKEAVRKEARARRGGAGRCAAVRCGAFLGVPRCSGRMPRWCALGFGDRTGRGTGLRPALAGLRLGLCPRGPAGRGAHTVPAGRCTAPPQTCRAIRYAGTVGLFARKRSEKKKRYKTCLGKYGIKAIRPARHDGARRGRAGRLSGCGGGGLTCRQRVKPLRRPGVPCRPARAYPPASGVHIPAAPPP